MFFFETRKDESVDGRAHGASVADRGRLDMAERLERPPLAIGLSNVAAILAGPALSVDGGWTARVSGREVGVKNRRTEGADVWRRANEREQPQEKRQ